MKDMTKMQAKPAPTIKLANGVELPAIGLGTWPMDDAEAALKVAQAIRIGWRHIDTAENYRNEKGVGEAVREAVREGGVARADIFVTSKFNREWHSIKGVRAACEASLKRLGFDYLDLFLVHWPNPDQDKFVEAVHGLVELQKAGLVRAIGTSNFKPAHLKRLFDENLIPQVNQIQLDPYHRRDDLVAIHKNRGIVTTSWSPLGRAGAMLRDPAINAIAQAHGRTPGQIVLRWHVEHGYVPLPKSSDAVRQAQNLNVFDFELTAAERETLDVMDRPDPDMFDADSFGH